MLLPIGDEGEVSGSGPSRPYGSAVSVGWQARWSLLADGMAAKAAVCRKFSVMSLLVLVLLNFSMA